MMVSELSKLKKAGNKLDFYVGRNPAADVSTDSFEISKLANTTFGTNHKSTNRISSRSKSNKGVRRIHDENRKNFIPDYKILKMLSKDELINNATVFVGKGIPKTSINKIKPNASNYISKASATKANYSTAIENLVNQALRSQAVASKHIIEGVKKLKNKPKTKHSKKNIDFSMNNLPEYHSFDNGLVKKAQIVTTKTGSAQKTRPNPSRIQMVAHRN
jgi:hypothetical protein